MEKIEETLTQPKTDSSELPIDLVTGLPYSNTIMGKIHGNVTEAQSISGIAGFYPGRLDSDWYDWYLRV